jgi:hypothetical protein
MHTTCPYNNNEEEEESETRLRSHQILKHFPSFTQGVIPLLVTSFFLFTQHLLFGHIESCPRREYQSAKVYHSKRPGLDVQARMRTKSRFGIVLSRFSLSTRAIEKKGLQSKRRQ